jgi:hypothetical protein
MKARTLLCLLVVPSLALAGCASDDPQTQSDDGQAQVPADFDDFDLEASSTTGILRGVVIDERIVPLAGAMVVAVGPTGQNRTMETKENGLFGFDGLEPGTYFVTAAKAGYVSVQASGEVVAGEQDPPNLKLLLTADPASAPFVQPFHLDGFITCSVRPMFIGLQCGVTENDIVNAEYEMARPPTWIQSEMKWESTQATGDELSLAIRCLPGEESDPAGRCEEGQMTITRAEGHSPLIATINETWAANWTLGGPDGNPLSVSIFVFGRSDLDVWDEETIDGAQAGATGQDCMHWPQVGGYPFAPGTCMRATGPGVVANQKVDVYTHVFYGFQPPEGWSFVAGEPVPTPP